MRQPRAWAFKRERELQRPLSSKRVYTDRPPNAKHRQRKVFQQQRDRHFHTRLRGDSSTHTPTPHLTPHLTARPTPRPTHGPSRRLASSGNATPPSTASAHGHGAPQVVGRWVCAWARQRCRSQPRHAATWPVYERSWRGRKIARSGGAADESTPTDELRDEWVSLRIQSFQSIHNPKLRPKVG
jgi:hypothetical protein